MLKRQILAIAFVAIAATPVIAATSTLVKSNPPSSSLELAQLPAPCDCDIRYRNCVQAAREPGGFLNERMALQYCSYERQECKKACAH